MQNITNSAQLKNAIALLENEQEKSKQKLIEDLNITYQKIWDISTLASAAKSFFSLSGNNAANSTTGIAAGYLIKKIVVGNSESKYREIIGTVLQLATTRFFSENPKIISTAELFIMQYFPGKKQNTSSDH